MFLSTVTAFQKDRSQAGDSSGELKGDQGEDGRDCLELDRKGNGIWRREDENETSERHRSLRPVSPTPMPAADARTQSILSLRPFRLSKSPTTISPFVLCSPAVRISFPLSQALHLRRTLSGVAQGLPAP